MHLLLLLFSK